jgi:hypothetical protein
MITLNESALQEAYLLRVVIFESLTHQALVSIYHGSTSTSIHATEYHLGLYQAEVSGSELVELVQMQKGDLAVRAIRGSPDKTLSNR